MWSQGVGSVCQMRHDDSSRKFKLSIQTAFLVILYRMLKWAAMRLRLCFVLPPLCWLSPRPVSLACLISKLTNLFLKWKLNLLMARHRFRPNEIPDSLIILPRAKKDIALFASQLNIETRLGSSNREINISKEHETPTKFSLPFYYALSLSNKMKNCWKNGRRDRQTVAFKIKH